jgi:hypothetical protein
MTEITRAVALSTAVAMLLLTEQLTLVLTVAVTVIAAATSAGVAALVLEVRATVQRVLSQNVPSALSYTSSTTIDSIGSSNYLRPLLLLLTETTRVGAASAVVALLLIGKRAITPLCITK